ncbi:DUF3768 domain-containing protein [Leisingera sp. HS039]|nr:DUF3768 domain-containing protein [Leisingera sp. HS039]
MALFQCNTCGASKEVETGIVEVCANCGSAKVVNLTVQAEQIAQANDAFRAAIICGGHPVYKGRVVCSQGVAAEGPEYMTLAQLQVAGFSDFNEDNDPHGDHSMGSVQVFGKTLWWKFDLYDEAYEFGADDPLDDDSTRRVLTLLFPNEY